MSFVAEISSAITVASPRSGVRSACNEGRRITNPSSGFTFFAKREKRFLPPLFVLSELAEDARFTITHARGISRPRLDSPPISARQPHRCRLAFRYTLRMTPSRNSADRIPSLAMLIRRRTTIRRIAAKHGARDLRVFGSLVTGTPNRSSDIDLLVTLAPSRSFLDAVRLQRELTAALRFPVDLVLRDGLSRYARSAVLHDAVCL